MADYRLSCLGFSPFKARRMLLLAGTLLRQTKWMDWPIQSLLLSVSVFYRTGSMFVPFVMAPDILSGRLESSDDRKIGRASCRERV